MCPRFRIPEGAAGAGVAAGGVGLVRQSGRPEGPVTADVDAAEKDDVGHGCRRGIFSSTIAACHAKVAMTMADCFSSSSLMRSG